MQLSLSFRRDRKRSRKCFIVAFDAGTDDRSIRLICNRYRDSRLFSVPPGPRCGTRPFLFKIASNTLCSSDINHCETGKPVVATGTVVLALKRFPGKFHFIGLNFGGLYAPGSYESEFSRHSFGVPSADGNIHGRF